MAFLVPCVLLRGQVATTNAATNVGDLSVTLNGVVNPGGVSNEPFFQYGTTTSYTHVIGVQQTLITGHANVTVSAVVNWLQPNTTYHFRAGTSPSGMPNVFGEDMTFTTGPPATPPALSAPSTGSVSTTLAQISCGVSGGSSVATVSVEYGTTTSYGSVVTWQNSTVEIGTTFVNKPTTISGLQPGTTYHYRFKAVNNEGTSYSPDASFTTLEAPILVTGAATSVTDLAAILNGTIDAKGGTYTIHAQYGTTTAYGQSRNGSNISGFITGVQPCEVNPTNLLPATTYHYRLVATDIYNTSYYGLDASFTTAAASTPPEVVPAGVYANVQTPTRAELYLLQLNTGSSATTVSYEYGLTPSYGSVAVHATPFPVNTFQQLYVAPVQLTGLTPGTTYHFRGKAANAQGTVYTDDKTFTAPAGPILTTGAAANVTEFSAMLNGTVNTNSLRLRMSFEYGTSTSYGSEEAVQVYQQNTSAAPVSVSLPYLMPGTTYHYRMKAVNHWQPLEVFYGPDATFTTDPPATPPSIGTLATMNVHTRSAQVSADVSSGSSQTQVSFEYGPTSALGQTVTLSSQMMNTTLNRVAQLTGLAPDSTVYFRCVAVNAQGSAASPLQTFVTMGATPPSPGAVSVTQVRTTAVGVQAVGVAAGSSAALVEWDYGTTTAYGNTLVAQISGSGNPEPQGTIAADDTRAATALLTGLQAGTTYHYRCRATSADGAGTSADGVFTTSSGPVLSTAAATAITDLQAQLNGSASANAGDLQVYFELGLTTNYGTTVDASPRYIGAGSANVSAFAVGLLPSTQYHFRLKTVDLEGNSFYGADMTFTTAIAATPPVVTFAVTSQIAALGATLRANVSAGSSPATLVFEWGTTTSYGSQITLGTPLGTSQSQPVTAALNGLTPSTTYYYRLVATNNEGTTNGPNSAFSTTALPVVTTGGASNIQATSVTLSGTRQTNSGSYTTVFDYGETTAYGSTASPSQVGLIIGGGGPATVTATALVQPQRTYHFRLRLTDSYGNDFTGADAAFIVPSAAEAWRQQHFGTTANTGNAADDANPAGDGIPNLMKYALWMNPLLPGTQPSAVATDAGVRFGPRYLGMSFPRNPNAIDMIYEAQVADSPLGPWTTVVTITPGSPPAGPGFVGEQIMHLSGGLGSPPVVVSDVIYVRDTVPLGSAQARFMRLWVQRQP